MGRKKSKKQGKVKAVREWIGGVLEPPISVGGPTLEKIPMALRVQTWLERPSGQLVALAMVEEEDPMSFADCLRATMAKPAVGLARRPERVRVATEALAAEARAALGDDTPVVVAPTPELDYLIDQVLDALHRDQPGSGPLGPNTIDESYLGDGNVPLELVTELFRATGVLHHAAPWKVAEESHPIGIDVPQLGVKDACLSVNGMLGMAPGLVLFDSVAPFRAYLDDLDGEKVNPSDQRALEEGTVLTLDLVRRNELPEIMLGEIDEHGWKAVHADAWPQLAMLEFDHEPVPLEERDVRLAIASALGVAKFVAAHPEAFDHDHPSPASETYVFGEGDAALTVKVTGQISLGR